MLYQTRETFILCLGVKNLIDVNPRCGKLYKRYPMPSLFYHAIQFEIFSSLLLFGSASEGKKNPRKGLESPSLTMVVETSPFPLG